MKKAKPVKAKKTARKAKASKTKTRKSAAKPSASQRASVLVAQAKQVVSDRMADNRLLEAAAQQYTRLLKEVSRRKKQLSAEKQVALEIGEKILAKAKEVSSSLVRK